METKQLSRVLERGFTSQPFSVVRSEDGSHNRIIHKSRKNWHQIAVATWIEAVETKKEVIREAKRLLKLSRKWWKALFN